MTTGSRAPETSGAARVVVAQVAADAGGPGVATRVGEAAAWAAARAVGVAVGETGAVAGPRVPSSTFAAASGGTGGAESAVGEGRAGQGVTVGTAKTATRMGAAGVGAAKRSGDRRPTNTPYW